MLFTHHRCGFHSQKPKKILEANTKCVTSLCETGEDFWWQLPFEEPFSGEQREIHRLLLHKSQQRCCGSEMSAHYKEKPWSKEHPAVYKPVGDGPLHIPTWRLPSKRQMSTKHFIMQDDMTEVISQLKTTCAINRDIGGRLCARRSFKFLKVSERTLVSEAGNQSWS